MYKKQGRRYGFSPYAAVFNFIGDSGGMIAEITWKAGNLEVICEWQKRQTILSKIIKSAIHVARLTIHVMDVRNIFDFSNKLVEDRRWQTR